MKVKVLKGFTDRFDFSKEYKPGDVIDLSDKARIQDLTERGLIELEVKEDPKEDVVEDKKATKKVSK
ncbi:MULTISPECIES: hypothetical protein [Dysgonomonas]|uniref:hypothetical protein n=1 Tax=Dysgonomonas TaxID=156973 RepID=UPI0009262F23|nr:MULTISPECIES: hypothetical protein [Dysgonomonas]MBN9300293.1 hypothetical protein [Dysgonomonas mossii]OJX63107.1 MAG: hypothetical protein BGO84_14480 [Dysgonomonas sp. 37-18]